MRQKWFVVAVGAFAVSCARPPAADQAGSGAASSGAANPATQTSRPEEVARRTIERRAIEAAIWGMPAVNYDLMLQEC